MPKAKREKLVGDEANFRALFYLYRKNAKRRGHDFKLTEKKFRALTKGNCYVCGKVPSSNYRHSLVKRQYAIPYLYNGVDRFFNEQGYIKGNVISCCEACNRAKGKLTIEQFLLHVYDIYKHSIEPAINEGVPHEHEEIE